MARLTNTGLNLISSAVGNGVELEISKFVFANIPELDHTAPESADEPMPALEHVVFEEAPTRTGIIDENRVTYSLIMPNCCGDFSFNWIGLVHTHATLGDQLVMFGYVPLTQKTKTRGRVSGNVLTRNMVVEYLGIANATPIEVSAESWMFDFGDELTLINQRIDAIDSRVSVLVEEKKLVVLNADNTCKPACRHRFMTHSEQRLPIADDGNLMSFVVDWALNLAAGDCRLIAPMGEKIQMHDGYHDDVLIRSTGVEFSLYRINGAWRL